MIVAIAFALPAHAAALRVCADPNNLPFSDRAGQGFENRIAERVAQDLRLKLAYTWQAGFETFLKRTLNAHKCDVVIGVPEGLDDVEETEPYYASSYVLISRKDAHLGLRSLADPRLRRLRIGVDLLGGNDQPPALALAQEGIVNNVRGFMIYGDRAQADPSARIVEAVADRNVDVAAVWGPLGGYYAQRSSVPLAVVPIAGTKRFAPLVFRFAVAMGVRKGDDALRNKLDDVIRRDHAALAAILRSYGVPLLKPDGGLNG